MQNRSLALKQLDRQLKEWKHLTTLSYKPTVGWIRTIRKALGMTASQLAKRLGLNRSRIIQLEHAEPQDAVTLRALRAAAHAMNCELIYALVPKNSLEEMLKTKAIKLATEQVQRVGHSMALEDQSVQEAQQKEQIEEQAHMLLTGSLKKLWET